MTYVCENRFHRVICEQEMHFYRGETYRHVIISYSRTNSIIVQ